MCTVTLIFALMIRVLDVTVVCYCWLNGLVVTVTFAAIRALLTVSQLVARCKLTSYYRAVGRERRRNTGGV
jgi:hypothetical protein